MTTVCIALLTLAAADDGWLGKSTAKPERGDVSMIVFGAPWCEPCKAMIPALERLYRQRWKISYVDIDAGKYPAWVKWHNRRAKSVPHLLVLVDGRPWEHISGRQSEAFLADWLYRAENEWRRRRGIEPVAFPSYGRATTGNEIDQEFFEREHWRLTPGTCGMLGCTIHGGGMVPVSAGRVYQSARPGGG